MPDAAIEVSLAEAQAILTAEAGQLRPGPPRRVPLERAAGRWLAAAAVAEQDAPPWPRAMRDGFALRADDAERGQSEGLRLRGLQRAGDLPWPEASELPAVGECVEIMTGAPVPPGADAVVMVEFTRRQGERIVLARGVGAGENIAPRGSELHAGSVALAAGRRLDYSGVALLASLGEARPKVYPPPRVAVLATGDELVEVDAPPPAGGQIRNSNGPALAALVRRAGGRPWRLPTAPDQPEAVVQRLRQALGGAALVLVSGGASVGRFDCVQAAWRALGGEWRWDAVRIRPGRPVSFGRMPSAQAPQLCFALPGNPVSAMLCFELFVRPVIAALAGAAPAVGRPFLAARMGFAYRSKPVPMDMFVPVRLAGDFTAATVLPVPYHGSADLAALAAADGYLRVAPSQAAIAEGDWVEMLLK
ncbi:MAG: molybdopterin molybdotransferase MoeA [Terriglobales bacterium]